MNYRFLPKSELELNQAIDYYETYQSKLGLAFFNEILLAINNIIAFPYAWSKISNECHRILLKRFPYGIIYSVESNHILIISIMNIHRKPFYWKNRIDNKI